MRSERKPVLGLVKFADLFEDLKLFPYVVTKGQGSRSIIEPGYIFVSIKYAGGAYRCDFTKTVDNQQYMLYAKPTQLFLDTFDRVQIDGLDSVEIIASPAWDREGGAIVIGGDKSFISREWIGLVDRAELPDLDQVEIIPLKAK